MRSTMAMARFMHTEFVLASTLGSVVSGGTIIGLAWDCYRHPDLQAVDPTLPMAARRSDALTIRSASSTQSTPIASAIS